MTSALLGHTGLVGSTLLRAHAFDATFHRANIHEIDGRAFDLLICSAAPAEKWLANNDPERDWQNLSTLISHLERVQAERFVLISTVDVYPVPRGVDETTAIDPEGAQPYGRHRYRLEETVRSLFPDVVVLRLPGLFGRGLKKNLVFDLLQDRDESFVTPASEFQFYFLDWLWDDVRLALREGLELVNLATPPVAARRIADEVFDTELPPLRRAIDDVFYDMRTTWASLWQTNSAYLRSLPEVLEAMRGFVGTARERV